MRVKVLAGAAIVAALVGVVARAVTCGQIDDFEDGSVMGWSEGAVSPNPPTNVADGGPTGAGDAYLRNVSSGGFGAGSKMVMSNNAQWTGDYMAAGVTRIEMDMANFGSTPLAMRVAIQATVALATVQYCSTQAVSLPADGQWRHVAFDLTEDDLTRVLGSAAVVDALQSVNELRVLSSAAGPAWRGDAIAATLAVDNIRAVVAGDCQADGFTDLDDVTALTECIDGPGAALLDACGCVDFDCDGDVDLDDVRVFQLAFTPSSTR